MWVSAIRVPVVHGTLIKSNGYLWYFEFNSKWPDGTLFKPLQDG